MTGPVPASRRRSVVLLAALLALLVGAAVAGVLVARDSGDQAGAAAGAEWNGLFGVDHEAGAVVVYDEAGEEVDRIRALDGPLSGTARGSYVLAVADDRAAVVDVASGEVAWDGTTEGQVSWLQGTTAPVVVIGDASGGDLRFVDVARGTDIRMSEVADGEPNFASHAGVVSPDGTLLAARDTRLQRSVVVDLESGEAHEVDGWATAVTDDFVVLVDHEEDGDATARFVGPDGEETGTAALGPAPRGVLVRDDDSLLVVGESEDGDAVVSTTAIGDDAPTDVATLDLTAVGFVQSFPERGRLVVRGEEGTVVLDEDGDEVATLDGEVLPVAGSTAEAVECFVVQTEDAVVVHSLDTGEEQARAEFEEVPNVWSSIDGCTLGGVGILVGEDGPVAVDASDVAVVAPDGGAALVRGSGRTELVGLSGSGGEQTEVDRLVAGFVQR